MEDITYQKRLELGKLLGLTEPVSETVFWAALNDEEYARNLILSSWDEDSKYLDFWLENLPKAKYKQHSAAELIKKAAKAFAEWGKQGFGKVSEEVMKKREDACLKCPHLSSPQNILQKLNVKKTAESDKTGQRVNDKICGLCGCNLHKKLPLDTENCPDNHPYIPDVSRWSEPITRI